MEIQPLWKNHPLYLEGKVELIPTEWVWQFRGTDVSEHAELKNGTPCSLKDLWRNIQQEGLFDPLIMRVGLQSNTMRLEAGNHRIQIFHEHQIKEIPVTVQVMWECGPHTENVLNTGTHIFDATHKLLPIKNTGFFKPSDVFKTFSSF